MESKRGFGHSTWQEGVALAKAVGVPQVAFIHHAPWRTDDELDAIGTAAAREMQGAFCARDGQEIEI